MDEPRRTREELIDELVKLCQRIAGSDVPSVRSIEEQVVAPVSRGAAPLSRRANVLIWNQDRAGRITCHSDASPNPAGTDLERLFRDAFGGAVSPPAAESLQRALDGEVVQFALTAGAQSMEVVLAPQRGPDGDILGVIGIVQDVTEQRLLDDLARQTEQMRALGKLAGGIAHDFNNLLTAILGNVALAGLSTAPASEARPLLDQAESAALRARDLTQQLLAFSKDGTPIRKPQTLGRLLRDVTLSVLHGTGTNHQVSSPDNLWPAEVDEEALERALRQLIAHADRAMPQGGTVEVRARNARLEPASGLPLPAGRYVEITIHDQGIGISEENLAHLFDPYSGPHQKRAGLGLATAFNIVKSHGGHIAAQSTIGVGTTMRVYLPAVAPATPLEPTSSEIVPNGAGAILVMDDERMVREIAGEMLRRMGYDVFYAEDGEEALDLYRKRREVGKPFDAVIMDLTVPGGMGGEEAVARLKQIDPHARTIVTSGYSTDPIMSNYARHGFQAALAKPYRVADLRKAIYKVIFEIDV